VHQTAIGSASNFLNSPFSGKQVLAREDSVGGRVGLLALCVGILFSTGCGGGSSSTSDTAQLRVFDAAAGTPSVNILVDGVNIASMGYGSATAYISVKTGSRHVQAVAVAGGSPVLDTTVSTSSSSKQTLLMTGTANGVQSVTLTDGGTTSTAGVGYVRVFNASSTMGASDVYIVNAGTSLTGATPTAANLAVGKDTGYQQVPAGNYEVFMTVPGTLNVNLSTGPLNIAANTNQTVIAFDAPAGGFTYILLTDQ
jgi:hypothetical protein